MTEKSRIAQDLIHKIVMGLIGVKGIQGHFCDWNSPHKFYPRDVTPLDVEEWVIKRIKEIGKESEDE